MRVNAKLNEDLEDKFEKIREFTEENKNKSGNAETVRTAVQIAFKKINEWEKREQKVVMEEYKKLKREIEATIEG